MLRWLGSMWAMPAPESNKKGQLRFEPAVPNWYRGESMELAAHNLRTLKAFGGVSGVDHEIGLLDDCPIVVAGVVRYDDHGSVLLQVVEWRVGHLQVVLAAASHIFEVRIVVADVGAFFLEQLDDGQRRRFAQVVNILFICDAQDQDFRSVQSFAVAIQSRCRRRHHVVRHVQVDFARQFNEASVEVVLLSFPGKIERVDRNAVTAESRSGIKRMETERLRRRRRDYLPDIDAHPHAQHLEFVYQGNIHAAVDVLEQLGHLGRSGRRYRHRAVEDSAVKLAAQLSGGRVQSAYHLGNLASRHRVVARILALGRESCKEALTVGFLATRCFQAARILLQNRDQQFFGRSWISSALQNYELSRTHVRRDGFGRCADVAEIRLVMVVERRGNADDHSVHFRDSGILRRGCESGLFCGLNLRFRNANDVRTAFRENLDLLGVDIKTSDFELLLAEQQYQRQTDVAQANNADSRSAVVQLVSQGFKGRGRGYRCGCHCLSKDAEFRTHVGCHRTEHKLMRRPRRLRQTECLGYTFCAGLVASWLQRCKHCCSRFRCYRTSGVDTPQKERNKDMRRRELSLPCVKTFSLLRPGRCAQLLPANLGQPLIIKYLFFYLQPLRTC